MKDISEFFSFLVGQHPLDPRVFNYLGLSKEGDYEYYTNLGLSPLYKDYIAKPFKMQIMYDEHFFGAQSDESVYLVPVDSPDCAICATETEVIDVTRGGITTQKHYHTKICRDIEDKIVYKIENGQLFQKSGYRDWDLLL